MGNERSVIKKIFLDAGYSIALSSVTDQYHQKAATLVKQLEASTFQLITTRAVILEIGNALSKLRYRSAAIELLNSLEEDPHVEIIPISEALYFKAKELYAQRIDKEWGITDYISFIIMKENGLTEALTADEHFKQAGFRALLIE